MDLKHNPDDLPCGKGTHIKIKAQHIIFIIIYIKILLDCGWLNFASGRFARDVS